MLEIGMDDQPHFTGENRLYAAQSRKLRNLIGDAASVSVSTPFLKLASILSASTPSGLSDGWEAATGLYQNCRTDDPFPGGG